MEWKAGMIKKMSVASDIYNAYKAYLNVKPGSLANWVNTNPDIFQLAQKAEDLRAYAEGLNGTK